MFGGLTVTLLIGLPPLPAPLPLMNALQKIEVESSTDVASVFRLSFGMTQSTGTDWDLLQLEYEEACSVPSRQFKSG